MVPPEKDREYQQIGFRQKCQTHVATAMHAEGILGKDMKEQYLWMLCMGEENYLKEEMGNTGNLKMTPEILKKGGMFKPL